MLAVVFLLAGIAKIIDPLGTRTALRDFGVPGFLCSPVVLLLPLLELAVGVALIPTALAWYGAVGALALLAIFLLAVAVAMARGRKPDCHCFGQIHSAPVGTSTLIRNIVLAGFAGWVAAQGKTHPGPELWTWLTGLNDFETKVAVVVGCAIAFLFFRVLVSARPKPQAVEEPSLSFPFFGDDEAEEAKPAERIAPAETQHSAATIESAPAASGPLDIGLPVGSPAPSFALPSLNGDRRSLESLLADGRDLLLIFSSPLCKSCEALASNLVRWTAGLTGLPRIIVVSRGTVQQNIEKLKGLERAQVLLQDKTEVANAYDCSTTPTGVLIGADGLIKTELRIGGPAIRQLLLSSMKREDDGAKTKSGQRASVFGG